MTRSDVTVRGWDVVRLSEGPLEVDVLPGKGADLLAVRHDGVNVLWESPWGLRARGSLPTGGPSAATLIEGYPGGWQTVFPNGGSASDEHGVEWGMHGEAWLSPWDVSGGDEISVVCATRLVRSPFELRKRVSIEHGQVVVEEEVRNAGRVPVEVMWSHHPAFGAPLLGPGCTVSTNAAEFVADDGQPPEAREPQPGARGAWPHVAGRDGGIVDLSRIPGEDAAVERFGYLTGFPREAWVQLENPEARLRARLTWDAEVMPHAWYWLEAHGLESFPWFRSVYVLGLEPASSWPGQGIAAVREKTGTQLTFAPGEQRTARMALRVEPTS